MKKFAPDPLPINRFSVAVIVSAGLVVYRGAVVGVRVLIQLECDRDICHCCSALVCDIAPDQDARCVYVPPEIFVCGNYRIRVSQRKLPDSISLGAATASFLILSL